MRRYSFGWELLGDIEEGRPKLGRSVDLEVYRLMQFTLRDVLEQELGTEKADELFYKAGHKAGMEFYLQYVKDVETLEDFVRAAQTLLRDKRIGVLRVEEAQADKIILTVDEDLDCSGMPELDYEICVYDEGFVAGLLEAFTKTPWDVKEIDCWCTGDRTCRFVAKQA